MICSMSLLRCVALQMSTFSACDKNLNSLIKRLEYDSLLAIEWFQSNEMKLNQEKYFLLEIAPNTLIIWESHKKKLLGLQIDRSLNFNEYLSPLCKKAGKNSQSLLDYHIS